MFRKAQEADLDKIAQIYSEIHDYEEANGPFTNWRRDLYPTRETAAQAIADGFMYVGEDEGEMFGASLLNNNQLDEYAKIPWEYPAENDEVGVIHTLVIRPSMSGRGYARKFVAWLEEEAARQGCKVMRLDTPMTNTPAKIMYPKLGYREAGVEFFNFLGQIEEDLVCYEKKLD